MEHVLMFSGTKVSLVFPGTKAPCLVCVATYAANLNGFTAVHNHRQWAELQAQAK